jgi:hypothetical protein
MKELDYPYSSVGVFQRVSWGAIIAGAVSSLAIMLCLTSLGVGIGLISAPAAGSMAQAASRFGIGNAAWMLVSGVVSFYAGGWIAGRLTGIARVSESVIHGFLAWSTATLVAGLLFTTAAAGALGAAATAASSLRTGGEAAIGSIQPSDVATASKATGAVSLFGFVLAAIDGVACCYGAKAGTRLLKPVPMTETHRERTAV